MLSQGTRALGTAARQFTRHTYHRAAAVTSLTRSHVISASPRAAVTTRHLPITRLALLHTSRSCLTTYQQADVPIERYHRIADVTLDVMVDNLEAAGEEVEIDGFDLEYSQGVMTLKLGAHGTYVINKQPPNKQIWLSSPKSGPKRFDYDDAQHKWFYQRDNSTLDGLLNDELNGILGDDIDVLEGLDTDEL
ncbi:hypothetical protein BC940DRAFT_371415 [Gongronella butleri]|nr:hypothetical protein BC940DRAFT_371415 [Gongronella butleri]